MTKKLSSQKGVSKSGVQLFGRALACGYIPSPFSCGPAKYLRRRKAAIKARAEGRMELAALIEARA